MKQWDGYGFWNKEIDWALYIISLKRVKAGLVAQVRHKAYHKLSNGVDSSRNNFNIPFLFLPKKYASTQEQSKT